MEVTFTLTKQDAWKCHKYATKRAFLRHPVYYVSIWTLSYTITYLALATFCHLFEKDFLFCLALAFLQCFAGAVAYGISTRQRYFKRMGAKPSWVGDRVVKLGKYDLRWGTPEAKGYYYHWSAFDEIVETSAYLYLFLRGTALVVPKAAFSDAAKAQAFVTEVRARWEAAKHRQRHAATADEGVWPPPPRIGA